MAQDTTNGLYTANIGDAQGSLATTSINDSRRIFNFGERVAELNPAASPFFHKYRNQHQINHQL